MPMIMTKCGYMPSQEWAMICRITRQEEQAERRKECSQCLEEHEAERRKEASRDGEG